MNIDINRILPVKVSAVCPIIDFITELQRCEFWEDVPLEFSRLSIGTVIISGCGRRGRSVIFNFVIISLIVI